MKYIIFLLLFIQVTSPIMGITWDGGAGTISWMDAANWEGDIIPQSNEDVIIGPGANVSLSASTQIQSLKLDNAVLKITNSGALVVAISSLHAIELDNSELYNYGKLDVLIAWEIGIKMISGSELQNYDSIVIDEAGGYGLELGSTTQLINYGVIVVNETEGGIESSGHVENGGELRVENTTTSSSNGVLNNATGTIINSSFGSMHFDNFQYGSSVGFRNKGMVENSGTIHSREMNGYSIYNQNLFTNEGNILVDSSLHSAIFNGPIDTFINAAEGVVRVEKMLNAGSMLINLGFFENIGKINGTELAGSGIHNFLTFLNRGLIELLDLNSYGILNSGDLVNFISGQISIERISISFGINNSGGDFDNFGLISLDSCSGGTRNADVDGSFENSGEISISGTFRPGNSAFVTELEAMTINQNGGTISISEGMISTTGVLVEEGAHFQNLGSISIAPGADDPFFVESGSTFDCTGTIEIDN